MSSEAAVSSRQNYRTRWLYFGLYGWMQCAGRFMGLYYRNEGLTDAEIGWVFAAGCIITPGISSALNYLADRAAAKHGSGIRLWFFAAYIVVGTMAFACQAVAVAYPILGVSHFWLMLVCRIPLSAAFSGGNSLLDAVTVQGLRDRRDYGKERLYGAYSWAIVGLGLGILMDNCAMNTRVMNFAFPVAALILLAATAGTGAPPAQTESDSDLTAELPAARDCEQDGATVSGSAFCELLRTYATSAVTVSFFLFAVLLGIGMALVENLIFLYFEDLHASYTVCGLSVVVTVIFEIPFFAVAPKMLQTLGREGFLSVAGLCWIVRGVGYTLIPGGAWILLFEPLHGVTYAAWQTSSVELMASITPPHLSASGQTFLASVRTLLATATGNLFGGMIIDQFGEAALYRGVAVLVAFGLFQYLFISRLSRRRTNLAAAPV